MQPDAKSAHQSVRGVLHRPNFCELCGCDMSERNRLRQSFGLNFNAKLHGHHWRGYDYPLEVWWVCPTCNHALAGKHDGSLSKEDAKQLVKPYDPEREKEWLEYVAILIAFKAPDHVRDEFERTAEIGRRLAKERPDILQREPPFSHRSDSSETDTKKKNNRLHR